MKLQPIKDVDWFQKDIDTGAILSIDNTALTAYKKKKQHQNELISDINNIKDELKEIRDMLRLIVSKQGN